MKRNERFYSVSVAAERCAQLSSKRSASEAAAHINFKFSDLSKAGAPQA